MLGEDQFAAMQQGSFFINTARETLVDEGALFDAVTSGHLGGAALDVIRPPQGSGLHPLLTLDNVIVTPHLGGATFETLSRGADMVAAEIERLAAGVDLSYVINPDVTASRSQ
jgi:D-3-phosphoglycerate dehydrogenase